MKRFTGYEWLLIDAANYMGLDKLTFSGRMAWTLDNLGNLEALADKAEKKPLYIKAVMAIRDAQAGKPIGHLVGVDACCSGIQIMSALTGCIAGATATGMVDPDRRADAYTDCNVVMGNILGEDQNVERGNTKAGLMTSFYGSKKTPRDIFGEDTPELKAFYEAAKTIAPGAWELLQDLLKSWRPWALEHSWKMPDGFDVRVKVMQKNDARIQIDELGKSSFTYEYYENKGSKTGLSNVANLTHSVDAYVLRCMQRRCNYDYDMVSKAHNLMAMEWFYRASSVPTKTHKVTGKAAYYMDQYQRSTVADITILPYLTQEVVETMDKTYLHRLMTITTSMLKHKPFELVTVHDEFKCHPNNVDHVRSHYREILADIADSNLLDDLLSQIYKAKGRFPKLSTNLGDLIRKSEYALC